MKIKEKIILIVLIAVIAVSTVLTVAFLVYKNAIQQNQKQATEKILSPEEVVQKYIEGDAAGWFLGGQLSQKASNASQYLVDTSNKIPIVTQGDFFNVNFEVVSDYKIIKEEKQNNDAHVTVNYHCDKIVSTNPNLTDNEPSLIKIDGYPTVYEVTCQDYYKKVMSASLIFSPKNNSETVVFHLIKDGNNWKINDPEMLSHISEYTYSEFQKEFTTSATADEMLTPEQVVRKYIEGEMAGGGIGYGPPGLKDETNNFLISTGSFNGNNMFWEDTFSVNKKFEIVGQDESDGNIQHIKVNFYCDKIVSQSSTGLKTEKGIKASPASGGESTFYVNNCSDFYKIKYAGCLDNQQTNENTSYDVFDCKTNTEIINFELVKAGRAWKINNLGGIHRVSEDFFNEWLKE